MVFDAKDHQEFFDDITGDGFHIFSRQHAKSAGFYPNTFPSYPELSVSDIKEADTITVRAFFPTSKAAMPRIDSGNIDLEVEFVDRDAKKVWGNILTELPATFALAQGTSIELDLDEVLFVQNRLTRR
ncbi:MAG: hypothetical protein WD894_08785 [Pirellulales bacterium]